MSDCKVEARAGCGENEVLAGHEADEVPESLLDPVTLEVLTTLQNSTRASRIC